MDGHRCSPDRRPSPSFGPAGTIGVTLVGFGAVVDIGVRLLGPILLAQAILAIRNRTKR